MQDRYQSLSQLSDEDLVKLVQQQDKVAFSILYDRYIRLVYTMAVHMVGAQEAEESVQEIFMRLWHKGNTFKGTRGSFKSWFMMVARNYLKDRLKKRHYRDNYQVELSDNFQWLDDLIDLEADVKEVIHRQEQRSTIREALNMLPAEQRQVILLAYFGEYTQSAIAKRLDWPLGTVKKRIRLGLQKLRKTLLLSDDISGYDSLTVQKGEP